MVAAVNLVKGSRVTLDHVLLLTSSLGSSTTSHLNTGPPETPGPTYTPHPSPLAKVAFNHRKGL